MTANDIWLIAGLGNPEAKYEGTRHNTGFAALDYLAGKWGIPVSKAKFQGLWGQGEVDGRKVCLLKPLTYMNLSGDSIAPLAAFFKIPPSHVIVLCDDVTQAPGKLRIRPSGSAGGHNGLKSIIARLGTDAFPRIRIGVGEKPRPDYDLADWVLGRFPEEDAKAVAGRWPDVEAAARVYFAKNAKDLTIAEAALIAGLGQSPSAYNPYRSNRLSDVAGFDFGIQLEGCYEAEIRFNRDTQKWEVFTKGGGFTTGVGIEFGFDVNAMAGPVPVTGINCSPLPVFGSGSTFRFIFSDVLSG